MIEHGLLDEQQIMDRNRKVGKNYAQGLESYRRLFDNSEQYN